MALRPLGCERCGEDMDQVGEAAWMCQPCKLNVYDFPDPLDKIRAAQAYLQREWQ